MTDLFPTPRAKVGEGNGRLLGHIANGVPHEQIRSNYRAGQYQDAHPQYLALVGVETTIATEMK